MPRMRTLKPEACASESLAEVDRGIRWTFSTFWTHCDDYGRAAWNLRLIKAALYPLDDAVTLTVLADDFAQLEAVGAVCMYEVDGKQYVHVPSFHEHQHPNRKVDSRLPECPKTNHTPLAHTQRTASAVSEPGGLTPVVVVVGEGRGEVEGEVVEGRAQRPAQKRGTRLSEDWRPSTETRAWTLERVPADLAAIELEKFRNHWLAKTGRDATKLEWDRTWRNWVLNARPAGYASPASSTTDQRVNEARGVAADLRREQENQAKELTA